MNALVAYGSSDDEEEEKEHDDEVRPEKRAKMAMTATDAPVSMTIANDDALKQPQEAQHASIVVPQPIASETSTSPAVHGPAPGPAAGPSYPVGPSEDDLPFDPYTYERQRLRELTMPTVPNFEIPDSPPPPPHNSEEAAVLAATTKKFERFLELKRQGVHFNERLQTSASLRNPSLLPKLMDFAGITREESYASSLSEQVAVPVKWPEDCYVEGLMKQNERREKKRLRERDKVEFVPARNGESSVSGTAEDAAGGGDGDSKRSKFDRG